MEASIIPPLCLADPQNVHQVGASVVNLGQVPMQNIGGSECPGVVLQHQASSAAFSSPDGELGFLCHRLWFVAAEKILLTHKQF